MNPPCVLVVDDSPTIRKLVEITLRREGFNVVFAENGITTWPPSPDTNRT